MKTHCTNKSLNEICSSINIGLFEIDDVKKIVICSESKPNCIIQVVEVDLHEHIHSLIESGNGFIPEDTEFNVELNTFDYIVFSFDTETDGKTKVLTNIPLFELIIASNNILADENGVSGVDATWDMNSPIWNCYE